MPNSDLEDLLKTRTFWFSDITPLQESVDKALATLRSEGKKVVVIKIFTDNTLWIGKKVTVLDGKDEAKEISVQFKPFNSVYQLDFEYYDQVEVNTF